MFTEAKTHMHDFYIQHTVKKRRKMCYCTQINLCEFSLRVGNYENKEKKNNCHQGLLS